MKTKAKFFWLCLLLISALIVPALANTNSITVEAKMFNGSPYIPLRKTFEMINYKVDWNDNTRVILIEKDEVNLHFKPDQPYFLYNGVLLKAGAAPVINNGRTYIALDTARKIFKSIEKASNNCYSIGSQLMTIDHGAKTLMGETELTALLNFYPNETRYQIKGMLTEEFDAGSVDMAIPSVTMAVPETSVAKSADKSDFSDTNNQVDGVSESDIVKTDGKYIYALKQNELQIIKAGRGKLDIVARIENNNANPREMFLYQDKVVLISNGYSEEFKTWGDQDTLVVGRVFPHSMTFIDVYDIAKLETNGAKRIKRVTVDGDYLTGRRIDQYLYLVANQGNYGIYPLDNIKSNWKAPIAEPTNEMENVEKIMYFPGHVSRQMIYTVGIDLNNLNNAAIDINACLGGAQTVYADRQNLYIANTRYNWWRDGDDGEQTDIYKFSIDGGKFNYQDSCSLDGHILNQFSMDVHKGYFRIAMTTHSRADWQKTLNHLLILNDKLEVVGKVADLAPGERIYSTRMMGNKVFIVTYREVDPFYVIDTTIPTKPDVLGYLKIPGYSNYLHPYDDNTIIGIGANTFQKPDGRVVNDGVKISLFDISDPKNPLERDKAIIGGGNAYSEVDYDHKAFLLDVNKNIMALPISLQGGKNFNKDAYIFNFTKNGMLNLKGIISHSELSMFDKTYGDYHKDINRILYIGDDLYTLSNKYLFLNDIDTLNRIDYLKR